MTHRAMHLAERGGGRSLMGEACKFRFPVRAKLCRHAPAHERPAHRRSLALELAEFGGIFRGQRLGDGGKQLRHLHDRTFQPAERHRERGRFPVARRIEAKQPRCRDACRNAADIGADAAVAQGAGREPVLLLIRLTVVHAGRGFTRGLSLPHIGDEIAPHSCLAQNGSLPSSRRIPPWPCDRC